MSVWHIWGLSGSYGDAPIGHGGPVSPVADDFDWETAHLAYAIYTRKLGPQAAEKLTLTKWSWIVGMEFRWGIG